MVQNGCAIRKKHWILFASGLAVLLLSIILIAVFSGGNKSAEQTEVPVEVVAEKAKEPDFRFPVREKFDIKNQKDFYLYERHYGEFND